MNDSLVEYKQQHAEWLRAHDTKGEAFHRRIAEEKYFSQFRGDEAYAEPGSALAIGREIFPDNTDEEIGYVLWNHTGYPQFWPSEDIQACLYHQLRCYQAGICSSCEGPLDRYGACARCTWGDDPDQVPALRGWNESEE